MVEHLSKQRPEVEGMDMMSMNMVEDTTTEVDVEMVEREHESMVLAKDCTDDGAERHRRTHQEQELAKLGVDGC
jgi:hypothetical protein